MSQLSFVDWVYQIFEETPNPRAGPRSPDAEFTIGKPARFVEHMIRLFREPEAVAAHFDDAKLDLGLFFIAMSPPARVNCDGVPVELRVEAVRATVTLFDRLFRTHPALEASCSKWWEHVLPPPGAPREPTVHDAVLAALEHIVKSDAPHCRLSARRGLERLEHPEKNGVRNRFQVGNGS